MGLPGDRLLRALGSLRHPDDFGMVDALHNAGIGVIVDWVPAHFPNDEFALRRVRRHAALRARRSAPGTHPDWGTLIFDFGRLEVRNFLVANALFWLDRYHVDGLRVDAVASMLSLDYSRKAGEWQPNQYGGNENRGDRLPARGQRACRGLHPGVVTIAEESTAFEGVTRRPRAALASVSSGTWAGCTTRWTTTRKDPIHRHWHHDQLTFPRLYMNSEHFVLLLSHDEVVHGKGAHRQDARRRVAELANLRCLWATSSPNRARSCCSWAASWRH